MDANMNGPLPPERAGDEEFPLIPLSPDLDRSQRAKALSQLSLQSLGSVLDDATDDGDDDLPGVDSGEKPGKLHQASLSGDEVEVRKHIERRAW
ncbi:hypothetical protein OS493_031474 [Desmophyllum pertusum]|uniref:Uncharacterized protein n=1 Tax=Desmophyllum pertusum TaxID=174260 RepID=A0A9W9ZJR7_9CNID|nr:hypothetical protein OS493_031474 [Desmophyllum pertusum]